ncbi:MAG: pantoate--beta-alanine ligase [Planctomycetes bacterium]|jgi:pantoate--beta-alanine ligase|nr:pantoate--beta-alanine ligase [Phycisphaerae bacterium]NBB95458.1 pantoate--beta-alanine ligase [Planctomycetota bacterium]
MIVAETIVDCRAAVAAAKADGKRVGFVPTMGALHDGHFSHIDRARRAEAFVAVSIFVNPTQFGAGEDLDAYPRPREADLDACRQRGVDLVFAPSVEQMYPDGPTGGRTSVHVAELPDTLCGRSRPEHFAGVCTVVAKLLNIVQPDVAYFGQKDYQQAAIVRRMVRDLDVPVEIVVGPTVREADGLAMSSRNAYLTDDERAQAVALSQALQLAADMIHNTHPPAGRVIEAMRAHLAGAAPLGEVDYIQIVDPDTLADVPATDRPVVAALAVRFPHARLIDNRVID